VRSCCGGCAKDMVQTMISTDVMILATIRHPPDATYLRPPGACNSASLWINTRHPPPATSLTPPGAWRLQLSKSLDRAHRSIHRSIESSEIGSVLPLESVFGSVEPSRLGVCHRVQLAVYLRATRRCTWVRTRRCSWECLES
jgi:hypothetical protein